MTSPTVSTTYFDCSTNTVRPESRVYPDGRTVSFDYGDADGINDRLSRIESLVDDDDTVLAEYQYLGLGAVVQQDSPEADLRSTLVSLTGTNDPDTGDIYSGLDRFGRVTDVRWRDVSAGSDLSRVQYGYDRASNRTWRKNPSDPSSHHDWAYGYDGLQRLKHADRGTLASPPTGVTDPQFALCWSLDATGNWAGFRQANTGNPWSLVQARTANPVNEITGITNSVGAAWAQPAYDPAGNMTTVPRPADPTGAYAATYDAWNRLVKLTSGVNTVQENVYDARGYRIVRKSYTAGSLTETRHYYYTNGWRCVEERLGTDPDSADAERQHVWGVRYIDDLVVRDRDTNNNGTLDERLYACQDGNWNTTAVAGADGTVQERYEYDPYGDLAVLAPDFSPRSSSSFDWNITYAGYRFDTATGLYAVRFRFLHPRVGWIQRDPLDYAASPHLYLYSAASPLTHLDPTGLDDRIYWGDGWTDSCDIMTDSLPPVIMTPPGGGSVRLIRGFGSLYYQRVNCIGHAVGLGVDLQTDVGTSIKDIMDRYGFDCEAVGDAVSCVDKCGKKCAMVYLYVVPGHDIPRARRALGDTDPFDVGIGTLPGVDIHGMRGLPSPPGRPRYSEIPEVLPKKYSPDGTRTEYTPRVWKPTPDEPNRISSDRTLGRWCCCRKSQQ